MSSDGEQQLNACAAVACGCFVPIAPGPQGQQLEEVSKHGFLVSVHVKTNPQERSIVPPLAPRISSSPIPLMGVVVAPDKIYSKEHSLRSSFPV